MLALLLLLATGVISQTDAVTPVASVELDRYLGVWHEIARYPNRFQRQCLGDVTATYARREDGRLDVINRCRTAEGRDEAAGVARIVDPATRAKLKVRFAPAALGFLPFVWGDYWILGLEPDYQWAVVGTPDRKYLWVLSRRPQMSEAQWQEVLEIVRRNGFDPARLTRTPQSAAQ